MNSIFAQTVFEHLTSDGKVCALSFKEDGTITGSIGQDLLGFRAHAGEFLEDGRKSSPNNIFDECPVFSGIENILGEMIDEEDGQLDIPSVILEGCDEAEALDLRLSRHAPGEIMLVASRVDLHQPFHFQRLRKARLHAYESELVSLERARFELVYRNNPVISFAIDQSQRLLGWSNEAMEFAAGADHDQLDQWIEDFLAVQYLHVGNHQQADFTRRTHEITSAVRHDGSIRIVDLSVHTIENSAVGRLEHYFVLIDVTEHEAALRSLLRYNADTQELKQSLEMSNNRLETFARRAAHDLVAPIGRMGLFSELLKNKLSGKIDDVDAEFYLTAITKSAKASSAIVNDILHLSRIESLEIALEACDLTAIIHEVAADIYDDRNDQLLQHLVVEALPETIMADPRHLTAILRNVLGNAWKYRHPDRPLNLQVAMLEDGHGHTLTISDNGLGFEMAPERDIFAPFVQLENAQGKEGSGLGLSIVRTAVNALEWTVKISSEPNAGTEVTLSGIRLA